MSFAQGIFEYGVKFILFVGVMLIGIKIGKILRMRKDAKNDNEKA